MDKEEFRLVPDSKMYHVVVVSPEVAEANLNVLCGMDLNDPFWLAIVQVGVVVRQVLIDNATSSGDVKFLHEAAGVDKFLSKLNEVRQGKSND